MVIGVLANVFKIMNNTSRTKNTIKNVGIGSALQIFAFLLSFITRSIFLKLLGIEYLSIDGLFANILTILNFTELGIGSAIMYSLYKPIVENNYVKIGALMNLYRRAYCYIACTIFVIGILVIPFLPYIVNDVPQVQEELSLLYFLFLLNTICTYIYGYKKSLLIADQKNYVVLVIYQLVHTFQILFQIAILFLTNDYIAFLLVMIGCTLLNNVVCTKYVDKKYSWLHEYLHNDITKEERKGIFSNIKSIAFYKFGAVVLNGTDNIIISTFIKTTLVGFCSNYMLVINSITTVLNQGMSGLMASVGNYNVKASNEDNEKIFSQLDFLMFTVLSFVSIGLCVFLNDFITIWLGAKYVLSNSFVFTIVLSFYVFTINTMPSTFRVAMGIFKKARFYPFIAALMNVALSIILAKYFGLLGVFWASIIVRLLCYTLVDTMFLYRYKFSGNIVSYFKSFILRIIFCIFTFVVIWIFDINTKDYTSFGFQVFFVKPVVFLLVFLLMYYICWKNNENFEKIICILKSKLRLVR